VQVDLEAVDISTGRLALENGTCVWRESGTDAGIDLSRPEVTISGRDFHYRTNLDGHFVAIDCAPVGAGSASSDGRAAQCVGDAQSCSSVPLSECSVQDGCHYEVRDAYSTTDDRCDGSATGCNHYAGRSDCERQRGCSWQD
jgi:hypothetical protein